MKDKKKKNKNKILPLIMVAAFLVFAISAVLMFRSYALEKKLTAGAEFLVEEQYEDAIATFNEALGINKNSADAYLGLAQAYIGLGQLEDAMDILQQGIDITGSENLIQSKANVYDEIFATYVMNHYSLNLLAGESEQLTITHKNKDFGFTTEFSSSDEQIATVSEDGLVKAQKDGKATISAHIGNETWGYRDVDCLLTVGVVVTFLEEAGCDYSVKNIYKAPAYLFQTDENGDFTSEGTLEIIEPEASYRILECNVSDPDAEGNVTYSTVVEVDLETEFGILQDSYEYSHQWYYDWNICNMFFADEYTGTVFLEQDLFGYEYPVIESELEFNNTTYSITGEISDEWINEENWETDFDEESGTTYAKAPVIGTFTYKITVPREYAGIVLVFDKKGQTKYKGTEDSTIETDTGFFDKLEDGSVRKAEDYSIIRLSEIAKHE